MTSLRAWLARDASSFAASAIVASLVVSFVAAGAGLSRVLPMVLAADVPGRAARPFLFGVLSLAVEVGFLVGTPLGFVEQAFRSRERGEARARMALGESPGRRLVRLWPALAVVSALAALGALSWGRDARFPGRVARALLEEARTSCAAAKQARVVTVPIVRATYLCAPGRAPVVVGEGLGDGSLDWAASSLDVADDLTRVTARDVTAIGPAGSDVRVRAATVSVRGLSPWTAPSSVPPWARALALVSSAVGAALVAAASALRGEASARAVALAIGLVGPAVALAALRACERAEVSDLRLLVVPASAVVATSIARLLVVAVRKHAW